MEYLALKCKDVAKKKLVYPVKSSHQGVSNGTEETTTIAMILIALAMFALTFAVAIKVVTMLVKSVISVLRSQFNWLFARA